MLDSNNYTPDSFDGDISVNYLSSNEITIVLLQTAMGELGLKREDIFITTKVGRRHTTHWETSLVAFST